MATHYLDVVRDVCERAAWLDGGRIRSIGDARTVADAYEASVADTETK
jgi:ABC-type polysaccharide/polyol phosphate transport system ATPase subunit